MSKRLCQVPQQSSYVMCHVLAQAAQAPTHPAPYWAAANGAQHRRTQSTLNKEDAVRRSGVTGPLGVGVVMQSAPLTCDLAVHAAGLP